MNYFSIKKRRFGWGGVWRRWRREDYFTLTSLCYSILQNTEAQNMADKPEAICKLYMQNKFFVPFTFHLIINHNGLPSLALYLSSLLFVHLVSRFSGPLM